jgi:hypothetical protein
MTGAADLAWAAIMLARDPDTCSSVLASRPVRAGNLDPFFLRRALRGAQLPTVESFVVVSVDMLEAVCETGAVTP